MPDITEDLIKRISDLEQRVQSLAVQRKKFEMVSYAHLDITSDETAWDIPNVDIINVSLPSGVETIRGIAHGVIGRMLYIHNQDGSNLSISNDDAAAAVGDKIETATGSTIILAAGKSALLQYYYDTSVSNNYWQILLYS